MIKIVKYFAFMGFIMLAVHDAHAQNLEKLQNLISKSSDLDASIFVLNLSNNKTVFDYRSRQALKPASVLKIVSSSLALKTLGPEYRFQTQAWLSSDQTLYIRGGADPALTIESLILFVRELKRRGIDQVKNLVLDPYLFDQTKEATGQRAYEAASSPLAFNFNSLMIQICPTKIGQAALVSFDPKEFSIVKLLGQIKTGKSSSYAVEEISNQENIPIYKLSGQIDQNAPCKSLYRSIADPLTYFATTLLNLMHANAIVVPKSFKIDKVNVDANAKLIYQHYSKPLSDIILGLNHFSNNFIAEQVLLAIGANGEIERAKWRRKDGVDLLKNYMQQLGISDDQYNIVDASGLDHDNRLSSYALVKVLQAAFNDHRIRPEFEASMSVMQRSGTLKARLSGVDLGQNVVRAKTGSLTGVSSLAGYIYKSNGEVLAFSVIQNKLSSQEKADKFEEKLILGLLN